MEECHRSRRPPSEGPVYCIRDAAAPDATCADCGERITGSGPVGYRDDEPVCDPCLIDGNTILGMVLALVAVNRCYGAMTRGRGEEFREALEQVGMFARVYECIAAKAGPIRLFHIPGVTDREAAPPSE